MKGGMGAPRGGSKPKPKMGGGAAPMQQPNEENALSGLFSSYADGQNSQLQMMQTPEAQVMDPELLYRQPMQNNPYEAQSPGLAAALSQLRGHFSDVEEPMVQPSPYRTSASIRKQKLTATPLAKTAY